MLLELVVFSLIKFPRIRQLFDYQNTNSECFESFNSKGSLVIPQEPFLEFQSQVLEGRSFGTNNPLAPKTILTRNPFREKELSHKVIKTL